MPTDPRVDAYIAERAAFARPILVHLRALVHRAAPEVEETVKWGRPFWLHRGRLLAMMAGFKQHCIFGFWRSEAGGPDRGEHAGGDYGRITCLADLPADAVLIAQIETAIAALAVPPTKRVRAVPRAAIEMPADFGAALAADPAASTRFEAFPPGARRDYVAWVAAAKRPTTRADRIVRAVAQIALGEKLNDKYR